jgi:hypothetical protein
MIEDAISHRLFGPLTNSRNHFVPSPSDCKSSSRMYLLFWRRMALPGGAIVTGTQMNDDQRVQHKIRLNVDPEDFCIESEVKIGLIAQPAYYHLKRIGQPTYPL